MRPTPSSFLSVLAILTSVGVTGADARPLGGRPGISVRSVGMSAHGFGRPTSFGRPTLFGRSGPGPGDRSAFGRGRRGFDFAGGYGGFGYGAYGSSGYYGYGSGYGYGGPMPGAGYLDGPYGPLIVPGYGGISEAPVQAPAIYVIAKPSASRLSASRRLSGGTSPRLASLSDRPERAGPRVIEISPQVSR